MGPCEHQNAGSSRLSDRLGTFRGGNGIIPVPWEDLDCRTFGKDGRYAASGCNIGSALRRPGEWRITAFGLSHPTTESQVRGSFSHSPPARREVGSSASDEQIGVGDVEKLARFEGAAGGFDDCEVIDARRPPVGRQHDVAVADAVIAVVDPCADGQ